MDKPQITALSNPFSCVLSGLFGAFLLVLAIHYALRGMGVETLVTAGLSLLYLGVFLRLFCLVRVDETGIRCHRLGRATRRMVWEQVGEVGILDAQPLRRAKHKSNHQKHIYFSSHPLTEQERFSLALHWPDRNIPSLPFSKRNYEAVALLWQKPIAEDTEED